MFYTLWEICLKLNNLFHFLGKETKSPMLHVKDDFDAYSSDSKA